MLRLINLTPGRILLVKGPALVRCEGDVIVLGKYASNGEVTVRAGKILPFEANNSSKIKVRVYRNGSYKIVEDGNLGVSIWKDVADRMHERPRRIMIVGATDTGKSTLTTYLSNIANANSLKVGVIDGDVGQGDLAPPGCIGAAIIGKQFVDLRDVNATYYSFIGSVSPMGVENVVTDSIKQIFYNIAAESDICIINTDGYVDKSGINYKIALARTLKPDLIVCTGDTKFDEFEVVRVNAPSRIIKTHAEREERRLAQYARFLGGRRQTFEVKEKNFMFMSKVYDHSIVRDDLIRINNAVLPSEILKGMFVGLGIGCNVKGFGVITEIKTGRITVRTPYEDKFDTIMLSMTGISRNMQREYHIPLVANR